MDSLNSLLQKTIRKRGLQDQVEASVLVFHAQEWIDENLVNIAEHLHVDQYKDAQLLIKADNSIASQECYDVSTVLLSYLQETQGHTFLEGIRLVRS